MLFQFNIRLTRFSFVRVKWNAATKCFVDKYDIKPLRFLYHISSPSASSTSLCKIDFCGIFGLLFHSKSFSDYINPLEWTSALTTVYESNCSKFNFIIDLISRKREREKEKFLAAKCHLIGIEFYSGF